MLDDYGFEEYEENSFPLAYLLTFRTYGTWLHGDKRSSYRRYRKGPAGVKEILANIPLEESMRAHLKQEAFRLEAAMRGSVSEAIKEVCRFRNYGLHALNVRTNHAHSVVCGSVKPEKIVNEFKAYSTRKLREQFGVNHKRIWSRGASTRYLWKPGQVAAAIDYVLYCQEDIPFEFREN